MPDDDEQLDPGVARQIVFGLVTVLLAATAALAAAAIYAAAFSPAERLAWWAFEAATVAGVLAVFGAVTWGSEDE